MSNYEEPVIDDDTYLALPEGSDGSRRYEFNLGSPDGLLELKADRRCASSLEYPYPDQLAVEPTNGVLEIIPWGDFST